MKIGYILKGMGATSLQEHMLVTASKVRTFEDFTKEVLKIEVAKKGILQTAQPMHIDAFEGQCNYCKVKGHKASECKKKAFTRRAPGGVQPAM